MTNANTTKHRVIHLPAATKTAAQIARDKANTTMRAWLQDATESRLPALVDALRALGLGADDGPKKAARWAFDEQTQKALADASEQTGLPQVLLLALVVRTHAAEQQEQPAPPKAAKTKAKGEKAVPRQRLRV